MIDEYVKSLKNFIAKETFLVKKAYLESGDTKKLDENFVYNLIKKFETAGYQYFLPLMIP